MTNQTTKPKSSKWELLFSAWITAKQRGEFRIPCQSAQEASNLRRELYKAVEKAKYNPNLRNDEVAIASATMSIHIYQSDPSTITIAPKGRREVGKGGALGFGTLESVLAGEGVSVEGVIAPITPATPQPMVQGMSIDESLAKLERGINQYYDKED